LFHLADFLPCPTVPHHPSLHFPPYPYKPCCEGQGSIRWDNRVISGPSRVSLGYIAYQFYFEAPGGVANLVLLLH
jgi:hypothetical protein